MGAKLCSHHTTTHFNRPLSKHGFGNNLFVVHALFSPLQKSQRDCLFFFPQRQGMHVTTQGLLERAPRRDLTCCLVASFEFPFVLLVSCTIYLVHALLRQSFCWTTPRGLDGPGLHMGGLNSSSHPQVWRTCVPLPPWAGHALLGGGGFGLCPLPHDGHAFQPRDEPPSRSPAPHISSSPTPFLTSHAFCLGHKAKKTCVCVALVSATRVCFFRSCLECSFILTQSTPHHTRTDNTDQDAFDPLNQRGH